jgi:hypothetical protein
MQVLQNLKTAKKLINSTFGPSSVEINGLEGSAVTPGLVDGQDYSEWLIDAGIDPTNIELTAPARISRWQVYDETWRTAYKFSFRVLSGPQLDLPLLYSQAKKTKPPKPLKKELTDNALVILWSDLQVGKVASRGGTAELLQRVSDTRARIIANVKEQRPSKIVFADVGDLIEGFSNAADMHQLATNDLSLMGQIDLSTTIIWDTLKELSAHCDDIAYLTVGSNHCQWRVNKQKVGTGLDDWGVHVGRTLARLSQEVGLPIKFYEPNEWDESLVHDVFGDNFHRLGLFHGHQAGRPDGVPGWITKQMFGNQPISSASIFISGHFHHLQVRELGNTERSTSRYWVQAKTMDSGSDWYRTSGGSGDSDVGVVCIPLQKNKEFSGTVLVF